MMDRAGNLPAAARLVSGLYMPSLLLQRELVGAEDEHEQVDWDC